MIEIPELRTAGAKTFVTRGENGEPVHVIKAARRPIHYEKDGRWLDINPVWGEDGVLTGVGYDAQLDGVGCNRVRLPDYSGMPELHGRRVWWCGVAPQTDVVLIASAVRLQLHVILRGPRAPRSFRYEYPDGPQGIEVGGRDNIDRLVKREGREQFYSLDIDCEFGETIATKTWSGRVKAFDKHRRKFWSTDVAYPVRII